MADQSWFVLRGDLAGDAPDGASPDIILGGPKPDKKYASDYAKAFNAVGNFGATNYVYARAKNAGTEQAIGSVSVFAVRVGSLQNQSGWVRLETTDGRTSTNISAQAGAVGVNGVPLIWKPGDAPPPEAPWCLIAEIDGDDFSPIKVPATVKDRASFDAWIADQPRMAYLVVQEPKVVPVDIPTFGWSRKVNLDNAAATTLSASLTCTKGPAGGSLAYSFDENDSSGTPIGVGETRYEINTSYSQTRPVPAEFVSTVSIVYTPPEDDDGDAEFKLQVGSTDGDGDDGDLEPSTVTPVANYTLRFGQTRDDISAP